MKEFSVFLALCSILILVQQHNGQISCIIGTLNSTSNTLTSTPQQCQGVGQDTCKSTTVYSNGFATLPTTIYSCVNQQSDSLGLGCSGCNSALLPLGACFLESNDGLTTTHCTKVSGGNLMNVTSCFDGVFSIINTSMPMPQTKSCNVPYCKIDYSNPLAPTGSCAATCTPNPTSNGTYCCADNNCNDVLFCYTGAYVNDNSFKSTMNKTVCPAQSSFCQNEYSYDPSNGIVVVGSCVTDCKCSPVYIGENFARGTSCCSTSLCNTFGEATKTTNLAIRQNFISLTLIGMFSIGLVLIR